MTAGTRHPIRGFFAGLLLGLAIGQLLVVFKVVPLSTITPWIVVVVITILGVVWALYGPTRARKGASAST